MNHKLRFGIKYSKVNEDYNYELRTTNHELRTTNHDLGRGG